MMLLRKQCFLLFSINLRALNLAPGPLPIVNAIKLKKSRLSLLNNHKFVGPKGDTDSEKMEVRGLTDSSDGKLLLTEEQVKNLRLERESERHPPNPRSTGSTIREQEDTTKPRLNETEAFLLSIAL